MGVLAFVVFLTLAISAACSLFEAVLYSSRVSSLEAEVHGRKHRQLAERFLQMKKNIAVPTSAILILNTIANTAGATVAGMYAASVLGTAMVPAFTVGLTLSILFLSELLPKTMGAIHWPRLWPFIVWPLVFMRKSLWPLIIVTQGFMKVFTKGQMDSNVTEEEIQAMIRLGGRAGELTAAELRLISAVFTFDDMLCTEIMLPRRDVDFLDISAPMEESMEIIRRTQHSRYPLCRGSMDEILGIVHIKDLAGVAPDPDFALTSLVRPHHQVPETLPVNRVLREMQSTRRHMAIVVDEYGTNVGIVTLDNVIEQLVGSIQDEFDAETPSIVPEEAGNYSVDGRTSLAQINRTLGCDLYAPETRTISGLIVHKLGRLPKIGETVELNGITAEVLEIEKNRARRIRLTVGRVDGQDA